MSAVPNVNATGPIPAAHRTETPVWAFHHAIAVTAWAIDTVLYRVDTWGHKYGPRHPRVIIAASAAAAIAAPIAIATVGGVL